MKLSVSSRVELNNHTKIPQLGLGVWQMANGPETTNAVTWALEAGYRHIDTAKIYGNEEAVGKAVRESSIKREDIWVTTKLFPIDFFNPQKAFETSLKKLNIDYIDLYLVHFPVPGTEIKIWKAMEKIYESGLVKAIGVSNFSTGQIKKILKASSIPPVVNQIKMSPFGYDPGRDKFLQENNIVLEAYSPLTRGAKFGDETLVEIADKYKKSPAQVLIRWALQHGMVVIPKSSNQGRIKENAEVYDFEISSEDMKTMDSLSGS